MLSNHESDSYYWLVVQIRDKNIAEMIG